MVGSSECTDCATGKLSSADRTSCGDCDAGTAVGRSDSKRRHWTKGHLRLCHLHSGTYVLNASSCEDCPKGYYAPTAQVDACLACGAGDRTEAVSKATTCSSCDSGTYSEGLAAVNCSVCDAGRASSTRASECYDCDAGESAVVTLASHRTTRLTRESTSLCRHVLGRGRL